MKLLLSSNSTAYGQPYLSACREEVLDFLARENVTEAIFIPYAGVDITYAEYTERVRKGLNTDAVTLRSIDDFDNKPKALREAAAIIVGGGNTFRLVHQLHEKELMDAIRDAVQGGALYIGWSAGSNVAGPSLKTTNDMPIIEPRSFDCLNLVSFQINPHYTEKTIPGHNGESRDQRLNEFLHLNPNRKIAALEEGAMLEISGGTAILKGMNPKMKLLTRHESPKEFGANDNLNFLLD